MKQKLKEAQLAEKRERREQKQQQREDKAMSRKQEKENRQMQKEQQKKDAQKQKEQARENFRQIREQEAEERNLRNQLVQNVEKEERPVRPPKKELSRKEEKSEKVQEVPDLLPMSWTASYIPLKQVKNGIIQTSDNRFVKIVEVLPINFLLRSSSEQRSIILSFMSYLKIAPPNIQLKVLSRKADIQEYIDKIDEEAEKETDERCKILQEDYAELIKSLGMKEAITRRFFLIFEYPSRTEMRMDENDSFFKLKEQLEDAQKLMGRMEQYIVEARGVLQSCIRRQSEFQYAYLGDMIQETAKTSERLTDKLRRLTLEIVVNPKEYEKYKEDLVLIHGIELEYKDEILRVSAPVLIPHRKDCYTDYLYKPLHTAFRNWCMQRAEEKLEIPTYTNCTICFVHVYDETLPLARVRDHDNYEEKHVQDIITNFFLRSDSGLYTNTCHVTRMGEEDRTLLYVMDSSKFPAWISDFGKETGIEKNHE